MATDFDRYESDRELDGPQPQGDGDPREPWESEREDIACDDMIAEDDDRPRRLSRTDRLQGLADAGVDTWADYHGDK